MKGLTWKKIMSLVLVAALVIGCLQLNAKKVSAADPTLSEVDVTVDKTDICNPTVTYDLTGKDGESVTNPTKTDIVLVIDLSGSMDDNTSLQDAKNAAIAFADKFLGKNKDGSDKATKEFVNIAVVTYGSKAKIDFALDNDLGKLTTAINGLNVDSNSDNQGTNYDDGLQKAQEALTNSTADQKVIVFMSDGEPTYANGTWQAIAYKDHPSRNQRTYIADNFGYSYYNVGNDLYRKDKNSNWQKAIISDTATDYVGVGYKSSNAIAKAATDEAAKAQKIATVYAILFNSKSQSAIDVMDAIATGTHDDASSTTIQKVYEKIGDKVVEEISAGKDARIEAKLSKYVKYTAETTGVTKFTKDGDTYIKWNIGKLDGVHKSPAIPFAVDTDAVIKDLDKFEVTKNEEGKDVITVKITTEATLIYTKNTTDDSRKEVKNAATIQFVLGEDILNYTINYIVDGETTSVAGKQVKNGTVTVKTLTELVGEDEVNNYDYNVKGSEVITTNNQVINVVANRKDAVVKFYELNANGEYVEIANSAIETKLGLTENISAVKAQNVSNAAVSYTWKGTWNKGVKDSIKVSIAEEKLYADYDNKNIFTVRFVDKAEDGSESVKASYTRVEGETVVAPSDVTREETAQYKYTFTGWSDGVEKGAEVTVTGDKTYYAQFETTEKSYLVSFVNEDNVPFTNDGEPIADYVTYGRTLNGDFAKAARDAADAYAAGKCTDDEYKTVKVEFDSWVSDPEGKSVDGQVTEAVVFTATYTTTTTAKQYTVRFFDGVTGNKFDADVTVKAGENVDFIAAPDKTADGYKFDGYAYVNEDNELVPFASNAEGIAEVLSDVDVYLNYYRVANIVFYRNVYGTESNPVYVTVEYSEKTTKEEFLALEADGTALGSKFVEWRAYPEVVEEVDANTVRRAPQAGADGYTFTEVADELYKYENELPVINIAFYPVFEKEEPTPITKTPATPTPTTFVLPPFADPTPTPTEAPATPTPTAEPTPVEEEPIEIEETETPEGDVEIEETETPEGAPEEEEELEVEPIDTPQGDLPQTGVAPSAVFFGIGAACVVFGGAIVLKLRRKEEM